MIILPYHAIDSLFLLIRPEHHLAVHIYTCSTIAKSARSINANICYAFITASRLCIRLSSPSRYIWRPTTRPS